jgi:outer membrane protein assembly factor BamA
LKDRILSYLVICFLILHSTISYSQESDTSDTNGISWFPIPFAFYTPETKLALGVLVITAFKLSEEMNSRPSSVSASVFYTLNNQYDFYLSPELFLNNDKYFVAAELNYAKIIGKYYGIGNDTEEIDNPDFEARNSYIFLKLQSEILPYLILCGIYELRNADVIDPMQNPYLLSGNTFGGEGGFTSGLGLIISYDSRNHIFYPDDGGIYELGTIVFSDILGSDFNYNKTIIDLRHYFSIAGNQVLAWQLLYNFVSGSAPFYDLPLLGGDNIMRGYFEGRFRDNHYFATQVEYRIRVWWRFGLIGFVGVGDVAHSISTFELDKFKYSVGAGLRFRIDETELWDLRVDVGFGKNTSGFYFHYNQAF